MLEHRQIGNTNILELTLDGAMSRDEFTRVAAKIEQMLAEHGKLRILEIIRNIGAIEPSALWEDFKFSPRHLKDFTHAAVVSDHKWIEWMTAAVSPFISAKVRCFPMDRIDEARRWLESDAH
ncbi:MAG: STAS/SEC14 domain-containing protein [Rhodanobacteraceae bacterium]